MNRFIKSVEEFCKHFSASDQKSGDLIFLDSPRKIVLPDEIIVSGELRDLYERTEMIDSPTVGGDLYIQIYEPRQLLSAHEGWRWIGRNKEENADWKKQWTIFANRNDDVLFSEDCGAYDLKVYSSIQQRNTLISSSMAAFFESLVICCHIEEIEYSGDTRNDDLSMKDEVISRMRNEVSSKVSDVDVDNFLGFFFS